MTPADPARPHGRADDLDSHATDPQADCERYPPRGRPFVIELAGTPRAGKTTAMTALARQLEDVGYRVCTIREHAGTCPVRSKRHPAFDICAACATLSQMLEAQYTDAQVVLVDRGLFDALCWMDWSHRDGGLASADHETIDRFLRLGTLRRLVDLVFVMTVEPAQALERESAAGQLTGAQPIMNIDTLRAVNRSIAGVAEMCSTEFPLVRLDTTRCDQAETLRWAALQALGRLHVSLSQASVAACSLTG